MAARRTKTEDAPAEIVPYNTGLGADDLALPRLRVVGKDADLVGLGIAKPLDVAIGATSDDEDSTVYPSPGNVKFHVLTVRSNYACGFNGPKGSWEEGDPEMPAEAKKQYHYVLCIPAHNAILPVLHTANGSAAKEWRKINTVIAQAGGAGRAPYEQAFELTTKMASATINGQQKTWPAPVLRRAEATPEDLAVAKEMHVSIVGDGRKQITTSTDTVDSDTPGF